MRNLIIAILISATLCSAQTGTITAGPTKVVGATSAATPTTVVLGMQTGSANTTVGANTIIMVPILTPNGAAGYTLANFNFNVGTSAGNAIVGIYNQGTANCPSHAASCGNTLICSNSSTATASGINTPTLTGCGTLTPSTYYYLALVASSGTLTLKDQATSYCPGTGYNDIKATPGSFTLPSTLSTQTEGSFCPQIWATFNCVASCGAAQPPWMAVTFTGNTSGTLLTATNLLTGASCYNGTFGGTIANATYTNTPTQAFNGSPISCGAAVSSGSLAVARDSAHSDFWTYAVTNQSSRNAVLGWWWDNTVNTMASGDSCDIGEIEGGNTWTFHLVGQSSGLPRLEIERSGNVTASLGNVVYSLSTWYFLVIKYVTNGISLGAVYNTSGTQIATTTNKCPDGATICMNSDANNSNFPSGFKMLNEGSCATAAGTMFYGPVLFDPTGSSFPETGPTYGEMFFPDSEKVIGKELAAKVEAGEIPRAQMTDHGWYSYALKRIVS